VTSEVIRLLRNYVEHIISYSIDDHLGNRDRARFKAFSRSVSSYDLCVVVREDNANEARARGARDVLRVHMSADEITHAPRVLTQTDHQRWDTRVQFVGTWFPERGRLMRELIERQIPLSIRGSGWARAPEWSQLRKHWVGEAVYGDDYAKAIQCAKVNLGLVSKGNRDL